MKIKFPKTSTEKMQSKCNHRYRYVAMNRWLCDKCGKFTDGFKISKGVIKIC